MFNILFFSARGRRSRIELELELKGGRGLGVGAAGGILQRESMRPDYVCLSAGACLDDRVSNSGFRSERTRSLDCVKMAHRKGRESQRVLRIEF